MVRSTLREIRRIIIYIFLCSYILFFPGCTTLNVDDVTDQNFLGQATTDLAATYAALILADDGIEITVSICLVVFK
jgi:hypothetical protein